MELTPNGARQVKYCYRLLTNSFILGTPSLLPPPPPKPYQSLGCWKDTGNRAVPTLEGKDPSRLVGSYHGRKNAIQLCYQAAKARRFSVFAVQHNGWCAGAPGGDVYKKYGKATNCANGRGGGWANDVYQILSKVFQTLLHT